MAEKEPLKSLYRDNPKTPEGKYLVKRRDGSVVEHPSFVLLARDPHGANTLRFYAALLLLPDDERDYFLEQLRLLLNEYLGQPDGQNQDFVASVLRFANLWDTYRASHGDGDPLMGPHRPDDPATIAEMKKGYCA